MKKIKVIHVSHAAVSFFMKGQKTLKQMILDDWFSLTAQQIKKFYPKIEIECWSPEKAYKKEKNFVHNNIKYRQFPTTFSPRYALDLSLNMLRALKKEIKINEKKGIKTIIHLHEYHNIHGLMIAFLFKKQKIIAQHHGGSWPLKHIKQTRKYKLFFPFFILGQIWENLVLKNISVFFVLSQDELKYLKKVAPRSKIRFQTMGIEEFYFKNINKKTARKKLKWPLNKKILIYVGRISDIKGIPYLIDAMESLKDVDLKIIGWGEQEKFENYVKMKKIKNIEFLGPIFGEKKIPYLSASDGFVLASLKEGASVSTMEALAHNLPVVVTDVGGMCLMIKNNREGIIIKPGSSEKIAQGVKKILSWKKQDVQKYAKKYQWKEITKNTVNEYC